MTTQNETMMVYYWQSGAWTDDKETAELAVDCLDFPEPEFIKLDAAADVDTEIAGLITQAEAV